jgi:hypothetical protein
MLSWETSPSGQATLETAVMAGVVMLVAVTVGGLGRNAYRRLQCSRWAFERTHEAMTGLHLTAWPPLGVRVRVQQTTQGWEGVARCGDVEETVRISDPL